MHHTIRFRIRDEVEWWGRLRDYDRRPLRTNRRFPPKRLADLPSWEAMRHRWFCRGPWCDSSPYFWDWLRDHNVKGYS